MIHDALDGGGGRHVWQIRGLAMPDVFVIAETGDAAIRWLLARMPDTSFAGLTATDRGLADRTELGLWGMADRLEPS